MTASVFPARLTALVVAMLCAVSPAAAKPKVPTPPARASIVVVRTETACLPADRSYAATRASRAERWLSQGGVKVDVVGDGALDSALVGRKLAFLVAFSRPTPGQLAALERFRARGGRVAALQCHAKNLRADWSERDVFSMDAADDEKAHRLLAIAGAAVKGSWNAAAWNREKAAGKASARKLAAKCGPCAGEVHAVWDHTGLGLYPGDWKRTIRCLRDNGVTDLFVNVGGAGFAHYASSLLPRTPEFFAHGDQLEKCLAAAKGSGVRVHAWFLCFNAAGGSKARLLSLEKRGWRVKDVNGRLTEYLNPADANLRWHLIQAIDEIVKGYSIDGLQLDYIRWYEKAPKPSDACAHVDGFVRSIRWRLKKYHPRARLSAAVLGGYPSCVKAVGQDWGRWLDENMIDWAVPMDYAQSDNAFRKLVGAQGAKPVRAKRTIAGIGVTANESTLSAEDVVRQILAVRAAGLAGVALFDLDRTLVDDVLPILRLGPFRR